MTAPVEKKPILINGQFFVDQVKELNFFDLSGEKSKTVGTSSKQYHIELHVPNSGSVYQIHTVWGATGGRQTYEWRRYNSKKDAQKDFDAIIKSKLKKGYKEIDVAQRVLGSEEAKTITKPIGIEFKKADLEKVECNLSTEVKYFVSKIFSITNSWVASTLKCPLGQLTNIQIDKGKNILDEAKLLLGKQALTADDNNKITELTNEFYSQIPHNLGVGFRGTMTELLLNSKDKIAQKYDDLDLLLDAKNVHLLSDDISEKYNSLNAKIEEVNFDSQLFKKIEDMLHGTRAANHNFLGKMKIHHIWKLQRKDEENIFLKNVEKIASKKPNYFLPPVLSKYSNHLDLNKELSTLYKKANVFQVWHGTRSVNMQNIIRKGLLIKPNGVVLTGSMYGNGCYFSSNSSKAMNYCDCKGTYWAKGSSDKGFLFLCDVAFGEPKYASGSYMYNLSNLNSYDSVYARAGHSGVINDELVTYHPSGAKQQHYLKYILEVETQAK